MPVSFVEHAEKGRLGECRAEANDQLVHMRRDALVPDMPQKIEGAALNQAPECAVVKAVEAERVKQVGSSARAALALFVRETALSSINETAYDPPGASAGARKLRLLDDHGKECKVCIQDLLRGRDDRKSYEMLGLSDEAIVHLPGIWSD